jgi:hypothetical protein
MNFNQKAVDKVIKCLSPLPKHFSKENVEDVLGEKLANANLNYDITFAHGVSKAVIICKEFCGVVLKIPFNGVFWEDYGHPGKKIWHNFENADAENPADYCFLELKIYKMLQDSGIQNFAAKTKFYKKKDGWSFYLQEEVIPCEQGSYQTPSNKSRRLVDKWYYSDKVDNSFDLDWFAACIDYYGIAKVKRFLDYCCNYPEITDDLHDQNYGYRKNGTPVLLDFCGFND